MLGIFYVVQSGITGVLGGTMWQEVVGNDRTWNDREVSGDRKPTLTCRTRKKKRACESVVYRWLACGRYRVVVSSAYFFGG